MHDIVRQDARCLIIVVAAGIHISIEAREVAAGNLNANTMAGFKEIARSHRLKAELVDLAGLHPRERLVIAIAITKTLNCFVQIVGVAVGIDVDQLHREVGVLHV